MATRFCPWLSWSDRHKLHGKQYPGVYVIARSRKVIAGHSFTWRREIVYVGMTNSIGGLKSRLQQFQNTIRGGRGHGGAARFRYKHRDYQELTDRLYVSASYTACDVTTNTPSDLKWMGMVVKQEYDCLATYVRRFGRLPEFNDKKRSPKK